MSDTESKVDTELLITVVRTAEQTSSIILVMEGSAEGSKGRVDLDVGTLGCILRQRRRFSSLFCFWTGDASRRRTEGCIMGL